MIRGVLLCLILLSAPAMSGAQSRANLDRVLRQYVLPSFSEFHQSAGAFEASATALCAAPSAEHKSAAQQAFRSAVRDFAQVEYFRIGPMQSNYRAEKILFYPDRRGSAIKQAHAALSRQDAAVTDVATLAVSSVAVQGFGAAEFLLFGRDSEQLATAANPFRCRFLLTIAANLAVQATAMIEDWQQDEKLRIAFTNPTKNDRFYQTAGEADNRLIGMVVHGLEAIRDTKVGTFLREEPSRDRPKSAVLWRSDMTLPIILHNLIGLRALLNSTGVLTHLPPEVAHLEASIAFELDRAIGIAAEFDQPLARLLSTAEQREKIAYLQQLVGSNIVMFERQLAPALGVVAGFSFGDGD